MDHQASTNETDGDEKKKKTSPTHTKMDGWKAKEKETRKEEREGARNKRC